MTEYAKDFTNINETITRLLVECQSLFNQYQKLSPSDQRSYENVTNITFNFAKDLLAFETYIMPNLKVSELPQEINIAPMPVEDVPTLGNA